MREHNTLYTQTPVITISFGVIQNRPANWQLVGR
jgi:hypothetical protein